MFNILFTLEWKQKSISLPNMYTLSYLATYDYTISSYVIIRWKKHPYILHNWPYRNQQYFVWWVSSSVPPQSCLCQSYTDWRWSQPTRWMSYVRASLAFLDGDLLMHLCDAWIPHLRCSPSVPVRSICLWLTIKG